MHGTHTYTLRHHAQEQRAAAHQAPQGHRGSRPRKTNRRRPAIELVDEKMKKPSNKHTAWKATKMAAKLAKDPEETQAKITEKALQAFALAQYLERHMQAAVGAC